MILRWKSVDTLKAAKKQTLTAVEVESAKMIWVRWVQMEIVSELEEVARLEKEIQMLQHFGGLQPQVCHFHIWFMKMEREAVMKEMAVMRNDQKDRIDFGRDCQVLTFMVNQLFTAAIVEKKCAQVQYTVMSWKTTPPPS